MSTSKSARGGCWPTAEQELLLQAIFHSPDQALESWEQWASVVDVSRLNSGSYRLLPMLYARWHDMGVEHPSMPLLQDIYRNTHLQNIQRIRNAETLLKAFQQQGIATLLLKGVALIQLYYIDPGLRPMGDVDILVRPDQASAAIKVLQEQGYWTEDYFEDSAPFNRSHALTFGNSDGQVIDLHGFLSLEAFVCQRDSDDFWRHSVQLQLNGIQSRALDPADQLLHLCVHGMRWNPIAPFRWIADAMFVLRNSKDELDWDRLVRNARALHLVVLMSESLGYLRDRLSAPVPQSILSELSSIAVPQAELNEYRARTNVGGVLTAHWSGFVLRSEQQSFVNRLPAFVRYLCCIWGLKSVWQLPGVFLAKGFRRVGFALTRSE